MSREIEFDAHGTIQVSEADIIAYTEDGELEINDLVLDVLSLDACGELTLQDAYLI